MYYIVSHGYGLREFRETLLVYEEEDEGFTTENERFETGIP